MIRILIFLLSLVLFAGAVTYFAYMDSRITGEVFGQRIDGPAGLIVGGVFAAFLVVIYVTHKIKDIMALPGKIRAREEAARRARGVAALTRGLEAVAVGDAGGAAHHARLAQRNLDDVALTRLLTAQAAQLSGDEAEAKASYAAMLAAPETEFLGLKGLYLQAMAKDDRTLAREYAERAFALRPGAQWAFQSVIELSLDRGAWGEAREAIAKGRRNNIIPLDKADRGTAALLTVDAYAAAAGGDNKTANKEAETALKLAPGFTPAALLSARLYADEGKNGRAAKTIDAAFALAAHPALIRLYDRLYSEEEPEKRAARLQKLAEKNPESREAKLLEAKAHVLLGEWVSAMTKLERLLMSAPTSYDYSLMAEAMSGLNSADAGRVWLERAANAPRDPRPGADGEFHFTKDGWARLVREYMEFARLSPPPLEDAGEGVSAEEIRLLTAPPAPDAALEKESGAETQPQSSNIEENDTVAETPSSDDEDDHIHDDEEAERAAAAAREVS